jgi:hypothetical protein
MLGQKTELSHCSVATLHGRFAYLRVGQNNDVGGPIAQLGQTVFDGRGHSVGRVVVRSVNGEISGGDTLRASYGVHNNCTGYFINDDGTPGEPFVIVNESKVFLVSNRFARIVWAILEK